MTQPHILKTRTLILRCPLGSMLCMRLPGKKWLEQKHNTKRKRRSWRKLHLGLDLVSGEIVCADLTKDDVGDPTALPGLLDQVDGPVDLFLADGAYDGEPTSDLLAARFGSTIDLTSQERNTEPQWGQRYDGT